MTVTAVKSQPKGSLAPVKAAGARAAKPPPPPAAPSPRRGQVPLTPMRVQAAKSMSRLADRLHKDSPDLPAHQHVRDAARMLRAGHEEAAQRHLRAAMFSLTPQSLHRNGLFTDDAHTGAREAMHGVHRHLLLVKDISDVAEKNQQALRRDPGDGGAPSPVPPSPSRPGPDAGYGPGALAQKPAVRQPPGNRALNAPVRADGGGSDPSVADPGGAQPKGPRLSYGWDELAAVIALTGDGHGHHVAGSPMVYSHGWHPLSGSAAGEDGIRRPGKGTVPKQAAAAPAKPPLVTSGHPPGPGNPKGTLSGSHPADRLTVASSPGATAKAMPGDDLRAADRELARRAALLGKPGQLSTAHKAVRAELARRDATGHPAAGAAPKGKAPAANALRGDAAYGHVAEPSGKKERDAADYYSVGSGRLNPALRNGTALTDKTDKAQVRNLESAFAKAPPTTRHIVAYRGTTGALFGKGDATGTRFTDKGFTSVSTDQRQAGMFGSEADPALMEIHVPAGSKVVKPGSAGHYSEGDDAEKELVLNHGGHYEITGDQMVNDPDLGMIRKLTATYRGQA